MDLENPILDNIKGVVAAYQPKEINVKECPFNLEDKG